MQNMFISVSSSQPRYRSGAVARMVGIPVSTLRIWERRYRVVGPTLTASGHRLYTGADVERLLLIKQLIDLGHAVGTVARLPDDALLEIADARAALQVQPAGNTAPAVPSTLARVALLGLGLARRLGGLALQRAGTWADLTAAEAALDATDATLRTADVALHTADAALHTPTPPNPAADADADADADVDVDADADSDADADADADAPAARHQADLLVAEMPTLQPASAERLLALVQRLGARRTVVVYGFGAEQAAQRLRDAGCRLHRAPLADAELRLLIAETLAAWAAENAGPSTGGAGMKAGNSGSAQASRAPSAPPPRRFDDAALAQLTVLTRSSRNVACECPGHLTELVLLLCNFETYSTECRHSHPADAALHAHLQQVAGNARAMFEDALVRVAEAESIPLPA